MFYFILHILIVVSWMIFFLQFIKSLEFNLNDAYIFSILSGLFFVLTVFLGGKLISLNPLILSSGGWLHLKTTLAFILGIENIYYIFTFFKQKKISKKILEISYWFSYVVFMFLLFLTFVRPF